MNKPRVARIVSYLNVGGVEKRLLAVLKRLKKNFEVEVICIHSRGKLAPKFEEAGIPVTVIPFKSRLHPISLYQLARYLRKRRIDIVHTHMYRPNVSGTLAARIAGVPVVISNVHNVDHWDTNRQVWMDRVLYPWRDRIIAVSESVRRDYLEKIWVAPERVKVIYNGVDIPELPSNLDKDIVKRDLGITPYQKVVACIARLVPQKGHKFLLECYSYVEEIHHNVVLLIIGDGPSRGYLESYSESLGLKSVRFLGESGDIVKLLSITDVVVLPSLKEGFSNVILESMSAAVPLLVTDVGGNEEAITNGGVGFVVPSGDVGIFEKSILFLLESERTSRAMGRRGLRRVNKCFSIDRMVTDTILLYSELLEEAN